MKKGKQKPYKHVDRVTDEQVGIFVKEFGNDEAGIMSEAIANSGIMEWPDPDECGCPPHTVAEACPHQRAYLDDQDEILDRTLRRIEPTLREAYRLAAEEVLGGSK